MWEQRNPSSDEVEDECESGVEGVEGVEKSKAYYPRIWRWVAYTDGLSSPIPPTGMNKPGESSANEQPCYKHLPTT